MRRLLLAALVAVTFGPAAHAANQTVLGTSFVVKDPSTPDKRKITVTAKEKASDDSIVGNPVTGGAALTITVHGTTPHVETFPMPVGMSMLGKPFWSGDATKGFKYKDTAGENGPVKTAAIKKSKAGTFTMKALIDGKLGAISVLPPDLGTDACALLAIENGDLYSVAFTTGLVKNKTTQLFKVTKPTAEGTCGRCGDGIIDPGEECDAPGTPCGPGAVCSSDCTCPCDFLDPSKCMFPFPSDYLTVADATTPTGRRIHFADAGMPQNASNVPIAAADYNKNDGFSPGSSVLLHVPSVDLTQTGAAPVTDAARSLDAGAPIVIVNADTLVHHPFWAELDANATSEPNRALILRPLVNYAEGGHYIVALRDMKDGTGAVIPPGADFAAYRDNTPTGDPVKEARRAHMESLFTTLAAAGVPRANLYLAWDFTVSSRVNNTQRVLDMRDDAFARLGSAAPSFVVSNVNNSTGDPRIARIVTGTYQVDRYVDSTTPPAHLVLDANGHPVHQATPQPAPFQCIIPTAALPSPTDPAVPARG